MKTPEPSSESFLEIARHRAYEKGRPFSVLLELTRHCNVACRHCYAVTSPGLREVRTPRLLRLLEELHDAGTLIVTFTGGEATLHPDFLALVRHATDQHLAVQVFTNGTRVTDELAAALAKENIFQVGVSVYGARAETHDAVTRRPGSFERTLAGVRSLRTHDVPTVLKYVIMASNIAEFDEMTARAKDLGVVYRVDPTITARDDGDLSPKSLCIDEAGWRRIFQEFRGDVAGFRRRRPEDNDFLCHVARSMATINAYGQVFGCVQLPLEAGNILDRPFAEIWDHSPVFREIRKYVPEEKLTLCWSCELRRTCSRCPGLALVEDGDLDGPSSEACRQAAITMAMADGGSAEGHFRRTALWQARARAGHDPPGTLWAPTLKPPCGLGATPGSAV